MLEYRKAATLAGWLAGAALLVAAAAAPAWAGQRVALVIGNADYVRVRAPALSTPLNDASDLGAALERLGFAVTHVENADQVTLLRSIRAFATVAEAAQDALVFYAGHAVAVDERNFLLPTDVRLASERDLEFEAVPLALVERAAQRARDVRMIILDASRENPFVSSMREAGATRSIGRGLARVEPSTGTLVAYAAREGAVAVEGQGRNSLYTETLLRYLEEPGLEVGQMFGKVREAVLAATDRGQEPAVYGSLSSQKAFLEPPPAASAEAPAATASPENTAELDQLTAERLAAERLYWDSVKDSNDPAEIQTYLDRYPNGTYAALAQVRLERLKREAGSKSEATAPAPDATAQISAGAEPQSTPAQTGTALEPEAAEEALGLERDDRRLIQSGLAALGFDPGPLDGLFGPGTRAAIGKWQSSKGMTATGYLGPAAARELAQAGIAAPPAAAEPKGLGGLSPAAAATLAKALKAAGKIEDADDRALAFIWIGGAFAEAGETRRAIRSFELAITATEGIDDERFRVDHLDDIAVAQANAGDADGAKLTIEKALATAARIEDDGRRDWAFGHIVSAHARMGDFREALAAAARIEDGEYRAEALADIAEARARSGDTEGAAQSIRQALAAAARIKNEDDRAESLAEIAEAQADAGDAEGAKQTLERALATAARVERRYYRDWAFERIARARARIGEFREALATAAKIEDEDDRAEALADIAEAQAKSGDADGATRSIGQALEAAARIEDESSRISAFFSIAAAQAETGDFRGALATAKRIEGGPYPGWALASIAEAQAKSGDVEGSKQTFERALAAAARMEEGDRDHVLTWVARSQNRGGDFSAALATARRIESERERAGSLADIAGAQAKAGDSQGALATAQRIADNSSRAQAFTSIALAQITRATR